MKSTKTAGLSQAWDLSLLYKSDTDPQIERDLAARKKATYKFINKWRNRTDYLESVEVLKEALSDYEAWLHTGGILGDIGYYFHLRQSLEEDSPKLKAKLNQLTDFATAIENDLQFFMHRLSKTEQKYQEEFLAAPALAHYRHFLKHLFDDAKYLLSEPEEKILNLKSNPAHNQWVQMTSSLLSKQTRLAYDRDGKLKPLPLSALTGLSSHATKKIRDRAAAGLTDILSTYAEVAEAELNAILLDKKINDELRGLPRPDSGRHLSDDVETKVVDTLVGTVAEAFDIAARFYKLKARLMNVPKLKYHERNVPYGRTSKAYSFDEAYSLVEKVFGRLDPDFLRYFQKFRSERCIDVLPKAGKQAGAFCSYNLPTSPVYILLNHNGELNDVLTLAHEAGHGINDEFMKERQPALYFGTPLVTAEVASTFAEDFVLEELLHEADDELRLSLYMSRLNDEVSTIIRQAAFYRFETELHQKFRAEGYLPKETIGKIFKRHMAAYMGPAVEQSPGAENYWVYVSHFRNFFYVYSYASGLLISKAMQASVKRDPAFMEKVKEFLRAGSSKSPADIFLDLGIDIRKKSFWQTGLAEIRDSLTATEKLAKKLGKI